MLRVLFTLPHFREARRGASVVLVDAIASPGGVFVDSLGWQPRDIGLLVATIASDDAVEVHRVENAKMHRA